MRRHLARCSRLAAVAVLAGLAAVGLSTASMRSAGAPPPSELRTLLEAYRAGDPDAAVDTFAKWDAQRVEREQSSLTDLTEPAVKAALALFHTEAGVRNDRFGSIRPDVGVLTGDDSEKEVHYRTAKRLVDEVFRQARGVGDLQLLELCRLWYVFSYHYSFDRRAMRLALERYPTDPYLLLVKARDDEYWMGPEIEGPPVGFSVQSGDSPRREQVISTSHGVFGLRRVDAEDTLRRALKLVPTSPEAQLRLGRVLYLLDHPAARSELEKALQDATDARQGIVAYLAALFLGQLLEDKGQRDEAARFYGQAINIYPRAVVARLALGKLQIWSGRLPEGWANVREVFADGPQPKAVPLDPWYLYRYDRRSWDGPRQLRAMRDIVRRSSGGIVTTFSPRGTPDQMPATMLRTAQREVDDRRAVSGRVEFQEASWPGAGVSVQERAQFRVAVQGVRIDVLVSDKGRPLVGLSANDFEVLDNEVPQRITSVEATQNVAVAVLVDASLSVQGVDDFGVRHPRKFQALVRAANAVADALRPGDQVSAVTFSDRLWPHILRSNDPDAVRRAFADTSGMTEARLVEFGTAVWDSTLAAASLVATDQRRPVVMLLSDGADNASWLFTAPYTTPWVGRQRSQVYECLRNSGIVIDTITVPRNYTSRGHRDEVSGPLYPDEPAIETGGTRWAAEADGLSEKLARRLQQLRQGYVLMFTPTGVGTDDGWHRLTVRVRGRNAKVECRKGYQAAGAKK